MGKKIIAFGELIWDVFSDGKKLGGAPMNFVYRVNTLGDTGFLISRIGKDDPGEEALNMLRHLGVSGDYIQIDPELPTGTATIRIGNEGRPVYQIESNLAFDHIGLSDDVLELVKDADCLFFGTLVQRCGISRRTLQELIAVAPASLKFLDLKLRKNSYTPDVIEQSLRVANILRVKENELYLLKNEIGLFEYESKALAAELINEYQLNVVLVTRGKQGAFALDREGSYIEDRGYVIDLLDTVGSGVAFSAGFIHIYLEEKNLEAALRFGNASGALTSETHGATIPISKKQIMELMMSGKRR
jgi:fructokinase